MKEQKSIDQMSFEEAMQELEQIVKNIDSGAETLDSAVSSFERGVFLKKHCEQKLSEAKLKIEKITTDGNSLIKLEPLSFDQ